MLSSTVQDYLKAIYETVQEGRQPWASTSMLAQSLQLSPASITAMLKKLSALTPPLIVYEPYQGARLTEAGEKAALEIVRHHRLLESFLEVALGYSWDKVHAEAHRLEHAISDELEEHITRYLGDPPRDPHGSPIPQRDGVVEELDDIPLSCLPPGRPAQVRRVHDRDPALLRYLAELGLVPGARLEVMAQLPFQGPQQVRLFEPPAIHTLGTGVTDQVFVVTDEETGGQTPKDAGRDGP